MQNQSKLQSYKTSPKHKLGRQTPRENDYEHDLLIDKDNGNTHWDDTIKLEID